MPLDIDALAARFRRPAAPEREAIRTDHSGPLTVRQARQILSDTSRRRDAEVAAAERVIAEFQAQNPAFTRDSSGRASGASGRSCLACGSGIWSIHHTADGEQWACAGCHLPPMTPAEWVARQSREVAVSIPQTSPPPRERLAEALTKLGTARAEAEKLTAADGRTLAAVSEAREAVERADEALAAAKERAAATRLQNLIDGTPTNAVSIAKEQRAVDTARVNLEAAEQDRAAISARLAEVRTRSRWIEEAVETAALAVLADETALAATAEAARVSYLAAVRKLTWLRDRGAQMDGAAVSVLGSLDSPPRTWLAVANDGQNELAEALERLKADAAAVVGT